MNHLEKISQFLYFQLLSIAVFLIYLHHWNPDAQSVGFVYALFTIILLPIVEKVFSLTDINLLSYRWTVPSLFIGALLAIFILWALWIFGLWTGLWALIVWLLYTRYFALDGRVYFLWALIVFLYVMLSLLIWIESVAEWLSIVAYYLLIAGVISQILENISSSKSTPHA